MSNVEELIAMLKEAQDKINHLESREIKSDSNPLFKILATIIGTLLSFLLITGTGMILSVSAKVQEDREEISCMKQVDNNFKEAICEMKDDLKEIKRLLQK